MLEALSIRNILLIDALDLTFESGLCVLTGETGAGKSILLNALGLALGDRVHGDLIRPGCERASVTAEFSLSSDHPAFQILKDNDIPISGADAHEGTVILRRTLQADGRSKAFLNDQMIGVNLLRQLSGQLIEIHGQFDQLLDAKNHLNLLDQFGGLMSKRSCVSEGYRALKSQEEALQKARESHQNHQENLEFLSHAVKEFSQLNPQRSEEESLLSERTFLLNRSKIMDNAYQAHEHLAGEQGAESSLSQAARFLEKISELSEGHFDASMASIDRVMSEVSEVSEHLRSYLDVEQEGEKRLEEIENRLFALRALARKHGVEVKDLEALREKMTQELADTEAGEGHLQELSQKVKQAREAYLSRAKNLRDRRLQGAMRLNKAIGAELPPLKLEKAKFIAEVGEKPESGWSAQGIDTVEFKVQTNPGLPFGGIEKIASGGERSRFMLALKVVLAQKGYASILVFDEIESGVSGAVASALGERLARLSKNLQVLTITHSPQIASFARGHWVVSKAEKGAQTLTEVRKLGASERLEEVARMLSGESVTLEARAAADRLMKAAG